MITPTDSKTYSVVSGYFSPDDMEAARDHNQRIVNISGNCPGSDVSVTFEFFRAFEKDAFLQQINATKCKRFINTYEIRS